MPPPPLCDWELKKKYWKLKNLMMSKILWFLSFFCMCISGCITIFLCLPKYFQDDEFDPSPNKKKQKVPLIFIYRMYKVSKKEVSISLFSLLSKKKIVFWLFEENCTTIFDFSLFQMGPRNFFDDSLSIYNYCLEFLQQTTYLIFYLFLLGFGCFFCPLLYIFATCCL